MKVRSGSSETYVLFMFNKDESRKLLTWKMLLKLVFLGLLLSMYACKTSTIDSSRLKKNSQLHRYFDLRDTTVIDCFTYMDIKEIKKFLKEQKVPINEFCIRSENTSNQCVGMYQIFTSDWQEFKKINYYGTTIPVFKFKDKLTINAYYLKNTPRLKDTVQVDADMSEFKRKNIGVFTEQELKRIEETYRYGIDVLLKGYLRE